MIVAEFIESCRTEHGIPHTIACRALEVSQSWFYKWIDRAPTARERRRARLGTASVTSTQVVYESASA